MCPNEMVPLQIDRAIGVRRYLFGRLPNPRRARHPALEGTRKVRFAERSVARFRERTPAGALRLDLVVALASERMAPRGRARLSARISRWDRLSARRSGRPR